MALEMSELISREPITFAMCPNIPAKVCDLLN